MPPSHSRSLTLIGRVYPVRVVREAGGRAVAPGWPVPPNLRQTLAYRGLLTPWRIRGESSMTCLPPQFHHALERNQQ
jgi:hypothetical protein